MFTFSKISKLSAGFGTLAGLVLYFNSDGKRKVLCATVADFPENNNNIWPHPLTKWDTNWDKRGVVNDHGKSVRPKSTRHIILIRHGHYNTSGENDNERRLTELGKSQAVMTGKRLKELDFPYTNIIHSTMSRAIETAKVIQEYLPNVPLMECSMLEEGSPIPPEPPVGHGRQAYYFHQDGPRIEAAFRKYFHRADTVQETDSYDIIVCHANIIRYFVCRALQYPPEGWLRLSLRHASITWLTILPSGRVLMRCYGDAGYMPPNALTTS